jgi:hypothetical protein
MNSGTHDSQLIAVLESAYVELMEHMASHPHEEDSLVKRLREMLTRCQRQNPHQVQEPLAVIQVSRTVEYLLSDDLPLQLSSLKPSAVSRVAQFGLSSRENTTTESMSASVSYKYATTFSCGSGCSIVSNSCYFVP